MHLNLGSIVRQELHAGIARALPQLIRREVQTSLGLDTPRPPTKTRSKIVSTPARRFRCPECGDKFLLARALGSHRLHKHHNPLKARIVLRLRKAPK